MKLSIDMDTVALGKRAEAEGRLRLRGRTPNTKYHNLITMKNKTKTEHRQKKQANGQHQHNITELKRAEEALRESEEKYRSLSASIDSMYLVDKDCTYLFMNEGCRMRLGQLLEVIIGRRYGEFHSQESARKFVDCISEVFETGKSSTKEHRSERDGRYFLRTFTPIRGRSPVEEISKVVIVSKDITDCKQVENDLIETLQQLQETRDMLVQFEKDAAVGRLATGVSHEILNSASIISSRLQFLEEENLSESARENLRGCREQIQRIVKINQDLRQSSAKQPGPLVGGDFRRVIDVGLQMTERRKITSRSSTTPRRSPSL